MTKEQQIKSLEGKINYHKNIINKDGWKSELIYMVNKQEIEKLEQQIKELKEEK